MIDTQGTSQDRSYDPIRQAKDAKKRRKDAENALFEHVRPHLRAYSHLERDEIIDSTLPLAYRFLRERGDLNLFSDQAILESLQRWAAWWQEHYQKTTAAKKKSPRPHPRYKPPAAKRGRERSILSRQRTADKKALIVQYFAKQGKKTRWIAQKMACTMQTVRNLLARTVSDFFISGKSKSGKDSFCTNPTKKIKLQQNNKKLDLGTISLYPGKSTRPGSWVQKGEFP